MKAELRRGREIVRTWGAAVLRPDTEYHAIMAGLNVNPHPLRAEGAAPKGRFARGIDGC